MVGCSEDAANDPGTGGTTGTGGAAGAGGSSAQCVSGGQIQLTVDPAPSTGTDVDWKGSGEVTATTQNSFTVNTCPPGAPCSRDSKVTITVIAKDFTHGIPVGAFVDVQAAVWQYNAGAKGAQLAVRNLSSWQGTPNPIASNDDGYLFLNDGKLLHADAPFALAPYDVGCPPAPQASGKRFDLEFSAPGAVTTIAQGQTGTLEAAGRTWNIHVVRAFESYNLDAAQPYAWWATPATP